MIIAPQSDDDLPGTWKDLRSPGKRSKASFTCPNGHICDLTPYAILENGLVHPLVFCSGCGFLEFVTLEGWTV